MKHRYVTVKTDRHGQTRTYYRPPYGGPHVRLPNNQESAAFERAYDAARSGDPIPIARKTRPPRPEKIPLTGVYLLMRDGEIAYVGSSRNMPIRIAQHRANGRPFDQAFYIGTKEGERQPLERLLIRLLRPIQNRYGNGSAN